MKEEVEKAIIAVSDVFESHQKDELLQLLSGPDLRLNDLVILCILAKRSSFREGSHLMQALLRIAGKMS